MKVFLLKLSDCYDKVMNIISESAAAALLGHMATLCTNQELGACLRARPLETGYFIELHSFFSSLSASFRDIFTSFDPSGCTETHISPASGVPLGCCCPSGIHPRTHPPVRGRITASVVPFEKWKWRIQGTEPLPEDSRQGWETIQVYPGSVLTRPATRDR